MEPAKEKLPEKQEALEEQPETGASEGQDLPGVPYPGFCWLFFGGTCETVS